CFALSVILCLPTSTLFPYTTLFRSKTLRNSNLEFIWELVLSNPSAYSLLPQVYPFANAASLGTAPRFRFYGDCFRQFLQMQFRKRDAALHCEPDRTAPACYFLSRNRVL